MDSVSPTRRWTGRIASGLVTLFLAVDAVGKLFELDVVVKGTTELGYPASSVLPIGVLLAIGVVLYVVPRTSVVGAIYISGYLGGAVATHVRVSNPLLTHTLFPIYVAGLLWLGLVLRDPRLPPVLLGLGDGEGASGGELP